MFAYVIPKTHSLAFMELSEFTHSLCLLFFILSLQQVSNFIMQKLGGRLPWSHGICLTTVASMILTLIPYEKYEYVHCLTCAFFILRVKNPLPNFCRIVRIFLRFFLRFFSILWVFHAIYEWMVFLGVSNKRLNCLEVASLAI